MKKITIGLLVLMFLLSACTPATPTPNLEQTAAVLGAEIAATLIAESEANKPTDTPKPTETPTPSATIPPFSALSATPDPALSSGACHAAQLTDETYPDGSVITPGQVFTQTWVLRNVGTCAWTDEFQFIYHHGNLEGTQDRFAVGYVAPGEAITFSSTFQAPFSAGSQSTYTAFYSIQTPDGLLFGSSGYPYFWLSVSIPGNTPTSNLRQMAGFGYSIRSNGAQDSEMVAGDSGNNFTSDAYVTFDLGNTPNDAIITRAWVDFYSGSVVSGSPFTDIGCMVLTEAVTGTQLYQFCNLNEMQTNVYGGATMRNLIQNAAHSGSDFTIIVTFTGGTNNDSQADSYRFTQPVLSIEWYKP
jgi:hypothetical protein